MHDERNSAEEATIHHGAQRGADSPSAPVPEYAGGYAPVHGGGGLQCVRCGYDLAGTPVGSQCPECGVDIISSIRAQNAPTSGKAVASMVLGICSTLGGCMTYGVISLVCGPLAIIFAVKARNEIATGRFNPSSQGMATAGLVTGILGCVMIVIGLIVLVLLLYGFQIIFRRVRRMYGCALGEKGS